MREYRVKIIETWHSRGFTKGHTEFGIYSVEANSANEAGAKGLELAEVEKKKEGMRSDIDLYISEIYRPLT